MSAKISSERAIPMLEKSIAQGRLAGPPSMKNYALADWADQTSLLISEIDGLSENFTAMFTAAVARIWSKEFSDDVRAAALNRAFQLLEGQIDILRAKKSEPGQAVIGKRVFIGHGRNSAWMELRELLGKELHLDVVEFNSEPTAGTTIIDRLKGMLRSVGFAFLIMTAEDHVAKRKDGVRARQNVIHEIGLFQGCLGFNRAIILLEAGCESFSNIDGLIYIPFPAGNIKAAFHEIQKTLMAAGLVKPIVP